MAGALALDSAHHVALIAYASPQPLSIYGHPGGILTDSNSRGQIDVVDTTTGNVLKTLSSLRVHPRLRRPAVLYRPSRTFRSTRRVGRGTRTGRDTARLSGSRTKFAQLIGH